MVERIKDLDGVRNRKGSVRTSSPSTNETPLLLHFPEEAAADVEEKRLEFVLGEKLCELKSVQNFLKRAQNIELQMMICSIREEKVARGVIMADLEQEEMMRLKVEEQRDIGIEFQTFWLKLSTNILDHGISNYQ